MKPSLSFDQTQLKGHISAQTITNHYATIFTNLETSLIFMGLVINEIQQLVPDIHEVRGRQQTP